MKKDFASPVDGRPPRRLLLGCFGLAFVLFAMLIVYIVVGHREAVGPYRDPPAARP